mmetsp:Transcript_18640/g.53587  ORF Transcript_18640/g.53587 Transcript_18640/m.53587 type:complete len:633 (-) Transcript_18640:45-1943(-)
MSNDTTALLHRQMASTWQWRIDTDPELAAGLGLLHHRRSKHAIDPRSLDSFARRLAWMESALKRIQDGISAEQVDDLSTDDKLSYQLYVEQLTDYIKYTKEHKAYLCCINRLEGPQTDLPLYARYLPVKTAEDRHFYSDFLAHVPTQLEEITNLLKQGLSEGRTPPKASLDGVVDQINKMVMGKMEGFTKPIEGNFDLPAEQELKDLCDVSVNGITAAFSMLAKFLADEYTPKLRDDIAASTGYPNGAQYYQDCLNFHTTTTMTPKEIHQLGLNEVGRMRQSMQDIAAQDGYEGRLDGYMGHLRTSSQYEPRSAEALCAHYRDIAGRISPELLKIFHLKTLPHLPYSIVETPAASASMAPAAYYLAGSADASSARPGTFYVNTSELPTRRTYECEALALHEAIPGHHTQAAIQGENDLPAFRRYCEDRRYFEAPCRFPFYTGYIEGWGLHCETLGEELGLYKTPSDKMGQLSMEALRASRLVVDTGMHAFGWSLEKANKYMLENTAMGEHDALTEIIRYATWPGQACAYKVGERFIHRLKEKAKGAFGDEFDPRDFYDVILLAGPVPLNVLEELVNDYIDGNGETGGGNKSKNPKREQEGGKDTTFIQSMTFANWCKCCVVPGTCDPPRITK